MKKLKKYILKKKEARTPHYQIASKRRGNIDVTTLYISITKNKMHQTCCLDS